MIYSTISAINVKSKDLTPFYKRDTERHSPGQTISKSFRTILTRYGYNRARWRRTRRIEIQVKEGGPTDLSLPAPASVLNSLWSVIIHDVVFRYNDHGDHLCFLNRLAVYHLDNGIYGSFCLTW